jgi:hypothetical protein
LHQGEDKFYRVIPKTQTENNIGIIVDEDLW